MCVLHKMDNAHNCGCSYIKSVKNAQTQAKKANPLTMNKIFVAYTKVPTGSRPTRVRGGVLAPNVAVGKK
jgi:hypothetical protein